jgi:hypothetical protein
MSGQGDEIERELLAKNEAETGAVPPEDSESDPVIELASADEDAFGLKVG